MAQTPFFIGFWRVLKSASNPLTHVRSVFITFYEKDWNISVLFAFEQMFLSIRQKADLA